MLPRVCNFYHWHGFNHTMKRKGLVRSHEEAWDHGSRLYSLTTVADEVIAAGNQIKCTIVFWIWLLIL